MLTGIDGVAFYESRLWNSPSITPETLIEMERDIAYATKLIRPGEPSTWSPSRAPPAPW